MNNYNSEKALTPRIDPGPTAEGGWGRRWGAGRGVSKRTVVGMFNET